MIYLAAPYRHVNPEIVQDRVNKAALCANLLARRGDLVYCPTLHGHGIDQAFAGGTPIPDDYWLEHGIQMLEMCDLMYILMLPGWDKSQGIMGELAYCLKAQKGVLYLDENYRFVEPELSREQ